MFILDTFLNKNTKVLISKKKFQIPLNNQEYGNNVFFS